MPGLNVPGAPGIGGGVGVFLPPGLLPSVNAVVYQAIAVTYLSTPVTYTP